MGPSTSVRAKITKLAATAAVALIAPALAACANDSNAGSGQAVNIINEDAGVTETTAGTAEQFVVDIVNFAFDPPEVTIPAGTEVVWTNNDTDVHSIVSTDDLFASSEPFEPGERYSVVFTEPGTYPYICGIHPFMEGTIIVE